MYVSYMHVCVFCQRHYWASYFGVLICVHGRLSVRQSAKLLDMIY